MKIDELTKQQIVLLCFLVAFVSSTASAIVVVRLMEEAPVTSSPTINRVIERTVQQVVPGETREITKVNTIVVKEEDLVVEAIEENKNSVVLIRENISSEEEEPTSIVNGSGLYLRDGYIVADGRLISGPGEYYIQDGEVNIPLTFVLRDESKFSLLKIDDSVDLQDVSFIPRNLNANAPVRVGQSAIILSANPTIAAFTGLISSRSPYTYLTEEGEEELFSKIGIDINLNSSHSGGVLVNSDGDIAGLVMVRDNVIFAIPANYIDEKITQNKEVSVVEGEELTASAVKSVPKEI